MLLRMCTAPVFRCSRFVFPWLVVSLPIRLGVPSAATTRTKLSGALQIEAGRFFARRSCSTEMLRADLLVVRAMPMKLRYTLRATASRHYVDSTLLFFAVFCCCTRHTRQVCTRNDDLENVISRTPASRRQDLVFLQNGVLGPLLEKHGLAENTQVNYFV